MNFVLGWELTPERVAEYAREYGFGKEELDNEDVNDGDDSDDSDEEVVFFTVVGDIHSRASMELVRFRACWDVDGNEVGVFAVVEEEADRLIDVRCTAADLPPEQDMVDLRTLLNHPDPSPKWYIHANGRWPGNDRVRAALDMTFDDEGDLNVEGTEAKGEVGEGEETEDEVEPLPARSLYRPAMNFVLGWELTPQRVLEYAQEHGFDKPEPDDDDSDDDDSDDDDSNDNLRRAKKAVIFFTVVDDIHSRATMELVRFRACWDVDGNEVGVFAVVEEEADRLIDVRCTAADLPPEQDLVDLRTLLNHPDPSPKWYIHANGRWPGDDRVRAALDMTFDDEGALSGEGTEAEGEVGEREETEDEDNFTDEGASNMTNRAPAVAVLSPFPWPTVSSKSGLSL